MLQYHKYWLSLTQRISDTEYAHLYRIYDILSIEETKLVAFLSRGYDQDSWSKLGTVWNKKKANWFRRLAHDAYLSADADRGVGMRRFTMHRIIIDRARRS